MEKRGSKGTNFIISTSDIMYMTTIVTIAV